MNTSSEYSEPVKKKVDLGFIIEDKIEFQPDPALVIDQQLLLLSALIVEFKIAEIRDVFFSGFDRNLSEQDAALLTKLCFNTNKLDGEVKEDELTWVLRDSERTRVLALAERADVRSSVNLLYHRGQNPLENIFHQFLLDTAPPIEQQDIRQLAATFTVCKWLAGTGFILPDPERLSTRLRQEELMEPFRYLTRFFNGREAELKFLADYVDWTPRSKSKQAIITLTKFERTGRSPLLISGVGGVGKTTLIAKIILDFLLYDKRGSIPFVYLDFDRPGLSIAEPLTLLVEAFAQLRLQFPESDEYFRYAMTQVREESRESTTTSTSSDRESITRKFANDFERSSLQHWPVLVVFDSFEEIQHRATSQELANLFAFLTEVANVIPRLRLVIGGRSDLELEGLPVENFHLKAFDEKAAVGYLQAMGIDKPLGRKVFSHFGGSPLTLQLAVELIKKSANDAEVDDLLDTIDQKLVQEQLVTRNLDHIHNKKVRLLAIPGILVRTITPKVIRHILSVPCGLGPLTDLQSTELYEALLKETFLVQRFNEGIAFRQDVREALEGYIISSGKYPVREIHERAMSYYQARRTPADQAEYLYHSLKNGVSSAIIHQIYRPNMRPFLETSFKEFSGTAYLAFAILNGQNVSANKLRSADDFTWGLYLQREIENNLVGGEETALINLSKYLEERPVDKKSRELIYQQALLFERLGDFKRSFLSLSEFGEGPEDPMEKLAAGLAKARVTELTGNYREAFEIVSDLLLRNIAFGYRDLTHAILPQNLELGIVGLRLASRCGFGKFNEVRRMIKQIFEYLKNQFGEDELIRALPMIYRAGDRSIYKIGQLDYLLEQTFDRGEKFQAELGILAKEAKNREDLEYFTYTRYRMRLKDICPPGSLGINLHDVCLFAEKSNMIREHQLTKTGQEPKLQQQEQQPEQQEQKQQQAPRKIVICCDGVWHDALAEGTYLVSTNVEKLCKAVQEHLNQVKFYDRGIAKRQDWFSKLLFDRSLNDIDQTIKNVYSFIISNYNPGDDLYFFGFSKGAYIVRAIIELIRNCGVLRRNDLQLIEKAILIYRDRKSSKNMPDGKAAIEFRETYSYSSTQVKFLGVWETVGPLGVPDSIWPSFRRRIYKLHDVKLSSIVQNACQALALDEKRTLLSPTTWMIDQVHAKSQMIEQVWFAGDHMNVGGGYPNDPLADISLKWMIEKAKALGLEFDEKYLEMVAHPRQGGELHEKKSFFKIFNRFLSRKVMTGQALNEQIHPSVFQRMAQLPGYRPDNIPEEVRSRP